jgi:hypothetical protein
LLTHSRRRASFDRTWNGGVYRGQQESQSANRDGRMSRHTRWTTFRSGTGLSDMPEIGRTLTTTATAYNRCGALVGLAAPSGWRTDYRVR